MATHPVETYLKALSEIGRTRAATAETSYYAPFESLLNEVGSNLKPRVRAVAQLSSTGAGSPDFGLFTASQFKRAKDEQPLANARPERGVVEVKGFDDDAFVTAGTAQVSKYWKHYNLVLVTNYHDFLLIGRDADGQPVRLESFRLAGSPEEFRRRLHNPQKTSREIGDRLLEFLRRVLLHEADLTSPEELAWLLASYAREARFRLDEHMDLPALKGLKKALEDALGMKFESDKGDHFFRATLIQTLFYGIFSSWVLWCREHMTRADRFDWQKAAWTLHVPMVKSLFEQIATPGKLRALGIAEVLDWAGMALHRVDRTEFFKKFEEEHAVQYFYEPFLKEYDPELRKELGVWYTPPEIVKYQVERVDQVLRSELGIADGLADDQVVVLDPCCGTGAYLVEVLKRIHRTLEEKGGGALVAQKLKKAIKGRVFGFEILPSPFVVSHLQLGLLLRQLGTPLDHESDERVGVYLTNALTGWEPLRKPKDELPLFPELAEERDAANRIKQEAPIIVILGNPPYNGFAGTALEEERDLVTAYRTTVRAPKPQGQGLNDLYVRFFRMAERRIVEKSGRGIVCYISNYSWLAGLSHPGMRERFLQAFDRVWIDNLHGDRVISEYAPDGRTSETIFALGGQSPGIKIGTAITLLVLAKPKRTIIDAEIHYRDLTDAKADERRAALLRSVLLPAIEPSYRRLQPPVALGVPFRPAEVSAGYLLWPTLPDLFPVSFPGVKTSRDEFLIGIDRSSLEERIAVYLDPNVSHEEITHRWPEIMADTARYSARKTREALLRNGRKRGRILRYAYRPFDNRWLYWHPETKLLDEKRSDYLPHITKDNLWLEARQRQPKADFDRGYITRHLADNFGNGLSQFFPLNAKDAQTLRIFEVRESDDVVVNLSQSAIDYVHRLKAEPDAVFFNAASLLHAPGYRTANAHALRQNWPRIPLPAKKKALERSAALGRRVADLLDTEKPVDGVTTGKILLELRALGIPRKVGGGNLDPNRGDLDVTAGWGHAGKGGVCMPGKGKLVTRKQTDPKHKTTFGPDTHDVYLNGVAYWENVPAPVWDYTIGGYQVIKKWLSYREKSMLGRALKPEEAEYVTEMIRRIAALILLAPELDANYEAVKADTYPWPNS